MHDDALESAFSFLPAMSLLGASAVSKDWHSAATSDYAWQARIEETLSRDPELADSLSDAVTLSPRQKFFVLMAAEEVKHAPLYISEKERVEDFFAHKFYELRRLGDIEGEGTPDATFKPFEGSIKLPIPRQAVLELMLLLDDVPQGKLQRSKARYIAEVIFQGEVSHQTVSNAAKSIKNYRQIRVHLIAPQLEKDFPQSTESAGATEMAVDVTPREDALLRRNEYLEMENERLTQLLDRVERAYAEERQNAGRFRIGMWSDARELATLRQELAVAQAETGCLQNQVSALEAKLKAALDACSKAQAARNTARLMLRRSSAARQADAQDAQARQERLRARSAVSLASVVAARERDRITKERAVAQGAASVADAEAARSSAVVAVEAERVLQTQLQAQAAETARAEAAEAKMARALAAETARAEIAEATTSAARVQAVRSVQEVKAALIEEAQAEATAGRSTDFMAQITGNFLKAQPAGELFQVGRGKQGRGLHGSRLTKARVGSADLKSVRWLHKRTKEMTKVQVPLAGGEEHLVFQLKDQRRAHPMLYSAIGVGVAKLSTDQLATLIADQTGACAESMLLHLKECGATDVTRKRIRAMVNASMSEVETGTITIPHPPKKGRTLSAAWLRVVDVLKALCKSLGYEQSCGLLSWPPNIPASEIWIGLACDKGGGATKLVAKFFIAELADSWRHTCLLAMLDRVDDSYDNLRAAWLPIYRQLEDMQQRGASIRLPWQPRLPPNIIRTSQGDFARRIMKLAKAKTDSRVEAKLTIRTNRSPPRPPLSPLPLEAEGIRWGLDPRDTV